MAIGVRLDKGGDRVSKQKRTVAERITQSMATWTFIIVFLIACIIEIVWNHSVLAIVHHWAFDPSTIILNLILSLIAAVQGSIIMIAQNVQAARDAKRDDKMEEMTENIDKHTGAILELSERAEARDARNEETLQLAVRVIKEQTITIERMAEIMQGEKVTH